MSISDYLGPVLTVVFEWDEELYQIEDLEGCFDDLFKVNGVSEVVLMYNFAKIECETLILTPQNTDAVYKRFRDQLLPILQRWIRPAKETTDVW